MILKCTSFEGKQEVCQGSQCEGQAPGKPFGAVLREINERTLGWWDHVTKILVTRPK